MKSAIVLCSGGLDSVVTAHYVANKLKYNSIYFLFFNYGQRSLEQERKFSKICAETLHADWKEIRIDALSNFSESAINKKKDVPESDDLSTTVDESSYWYVPCRNLLFLSFAISFAESLFLEDTISRDIFVGFKNDGEETFPDASIEFVKHVNKVATCAKGDIKIIAPLLDKDKEDIINLGQKLEVSFEKTFSCYVGTKNHCGKCLACKLRRKGFYWANITDPTQYDS